MDNTTPDYTGKIVFSIEASKAPAGKLYLKSFASGTYQNGTWVNEGKTFAHEVDKAGYHRSDVAMLMQQNAGELVNTSVRVSWQRMKHRRFRIRFPIGHWG